MWIFSTLLLCVAIELFYYTIKEFRNDCKRYCK